MSLFFHLLVLFSSETNHFVSVSILFILLEFSLHIYHFSRFFSIPVFKFYSSPRNLKNIPTISEFNEIRQGS